MPTERFFRTSYGKRIPLIPKPNCYFCSKPIPDSYAEWRQCSDCTELFRDPPVGIAGYKIGNFRVSPYAFYRAIAASLYLAHEQDPGLLGKMVKQLKIDGANVDVIGSAMLHSLQEELKDYNPDAIVPIPRVIPSQIYPARLIAEFISEKLKSSMMDILSFVPGHTPSKEIGGKEKFLHAKDKLLVSSSLNLSNKKLLLIDDILTTGGTCHWASCTLRQIEASEVIVLVACRDVSRQHLEFINYKGAI